MKRSLQQRASSTGPGQIMIEFALVLPVIVLLLLGTMDLARAVYAYGVISDAARTGAHWGSLRPLNPDGTMNQFGATNENSVEYRTYKQTAGLDRSSLSLAVDCFQNPENQYEKGLTPPSQIDDPVGYNKFMCASWNWVTVVVKYQFQPITIFFSKFQLQAESTMTIE